MANWIADGTAARSDAYVASCDISASPIGDMMRPVLDRLMQGTGLQLTHFGPSINLWWGPPGHREGLHVDITDGTLLQLAGLKRVLLFPPDQWKNLYPWPPSDVSGKTSWAFSQVSGVVPQDMAKYPLLANAMPHRAEVLLRPGDLLYIPAGEDGRVLIWV